MKNWHPGASECVSLVFIKTFTTVLIPLFPDLIKYAFLKKGASHIFCDSALDVQLYFYIKLNNTDILRRYAQDTLGSCILGPPPSIRKVNDSMTEITQYRSLAIRHWYIMFRIHTIFSFFPPYVIFPNSRRF